MTQLELLRRAQRLTQAELAIRAGCSTSSIANLERGHWARPSDRFLVRLAEALGVSADRSRDLLDAVPLALMGAHAGAHENAAVVA
jgi:transcriptional regulator with XRE-family HTH domain